MVLGELVLRPIPIVVAHRVSKYAAALGVKDDFVRVARRYAQGAYGLRVDGSPAQRVRRARARGGRRRSTADRAVAAPTPFEPAQVDAELEAKWLAFESLPRRFARALGVGDVHGRGFGLPGSPGGAPAYLAQHDFVHVLADYGTNLKGELEVFAFIGRADPDPKGFAWLATLIGLFETGYIKDTGFFERDVRERHIQAPGMHQRLADAIRRGKVVSQGYGIDLFDVDYYALADRPVDEVRDIIGVPPKSPGALEGGSAGTFDLDGMSEIQRQYVAKHGGNEP